MDQLVSVNIVIYNGEKYIRQCLDSVLRQNYPRDQIEVNIFDNNSTDATLEIIESNLANWKSIITNFRHIKYSSNIGMWPGQEELLKNSRGEYILALSVDVVLDRDFISKALTVFNRDTTIGAVQGKVYKYVISSLKKTEGHNIIDTCGFEIFRSRRLSNIGHGEKDSGQYNSEGEIFGVEGAVPIFRKRALEDCRVVGEIADHKYFWYGDDFDIAWRMRLFGWKQVYTPEAVAYHDRLTTKTISKNYGDFMAIRQTVPMFKRRLDWRNTTLTIIKNDFAVNLMKDLHLIIWRQFRLWIYFLFYEPVMFIELFNIVKMLPNMLKKRRVILARSKISPQKIHRWFK
mgnify:FL=1